MATSDVNHIFNQSVDRLFQGWTVLQLAVQQGFGGQHSQEKAAWMVEAVCNWFQENDGIEPYELEDFIAALLDNEFDTRAEDGSLHVIAKNICANFAMCQAGQANAVAQKLQQLPIADTSKCIADATNDAQEESMDDSGIGEHNVNAMMNGMELGSTSTQESSIAKANHENQNSTEVKNNECHTAEDDGWTVVRKPRKK